MASSIIPKSLASDVEEINSNMGGLTLLQGRVTNGTSWSFTATYAVIILFGSTTTALNGLYGCRSGVISKMIEATSVDVSASGTTYTITNNHVNTGVRYMIIATES